MARYSGLFDGVTHLMSAFHAFRQQGSWTERRTDNIVDGGAPFYRTYATRDGKFVAVGAIEPHFYANLLKVLGLNAEELPDQNDRSAWPGMRERFAGIFAKQTRDEWVTAAMGQDASVKMNLQSPRSAATSAINTCLCLPPDRSSLALEPIAILRSHLPPHSNPHNRERGTFRAPSPAGSFLGGFRTTAPVLAAPSRSAVIRNPQQEQKLLSLKAGRARLSSRLDLVSQDLQRTSHRA